jgi:hypothetical protein
MRQPAVCAVRLLRAATHFCTSDRVLPGHAQEFVRSLAARPDTQETLDWSVQQLRDLTERTAIIRWDDRLGILGVIAGTEYTFYWTAGLLVAMMTWMLTDNMTLRILPAFLFDVFATASLGFWFRGGPVFSFLGIEVRRSNGQPASRLRCAWRNVVAWIPLISFNACLPFFINMPPQAFSGEDLKPEQLALMLLSCNGCCLISVAMLGLVFSIVQPQRGWQDYLAGTCLVPR